MKFSDWIQSLGFVTQSAHFFAGATIVLGAGLWLPWYWAYPLLLVWVLPKEFIYDKDLLGENHGKPDLLDALFYLLGGGLAAGLLALKGYANGL
jgi:hypothetical protein